jgi:hypothetical protein
MTSATASSSQPARPRTVLLSAAVAPGASDDPTGARKSFDTLVAVAHFCRFAFERDLHIVSPAYPVLAGMILDAAERFRPVRARHDDDRGGYATFFVASRGRGPHEPRALDLCNWRERHDVGSLREVAAVDAIGARASVRRAMLAAGPFIGAVFVGGDDDVYDDGIAFRDEHPDSPQFALDVGGGGAARLHQSGLSTVDVTGEKSLIVMMSRVFAAIETSSRREAGTVSRD